MPSKTIFPLLLSAAVAGFSQNVLSNGDMEYGDGGWYLWNNPDSPARAEVQIGVKGLGVDSSRGAKVVIQNPPGTWWGLQLQAPKFLADSTFYTLSFQAKGDIPVTATIQGGPPDYRQKESARFQLTPQWRTFSMTFLADQKGYGLNNAVFQIGYQKGRVQIDNVEIEPLAGGMDSSWYAAADARIDSLRKVDFTVKAAPGKKVSVELVRHAFPFGTAIALQDTRDSLEKWYRAEATKIFWNGVPENQFKWPEYEPKKGKLRKEAMQEYVNFAKDNGWQLRGHALVWAIQGYNYDKHFSNHGSCADIAANIKTRIARDVAAYRGTFSEYDVWNEPLHEPFLFNKCGWSLLDSAFVWAHRADPAARLYINEYNVVAGGETDSYYTLVQGMLKRKIPVSGIGVQCHFQKRPVVVPLIKERLDKLGSLGLPVKITELDFGSNETGLSMSEAEQAKRYEIFLKTAFSHPAVKGILLWGFWDSRHWIPNGGIVAADGREKPAARLIYDLWHKTWTTKATATADAQGIAHFRGFPGKYKVTINSRTETLSVK